MVRTSSAVINVTDNSPVHHGGHTTGHIPDVDRSNVSPSKGKHIWNKIRARQPQLSLYLKTDCISLRVHMPSPVQNSPLFSNKLEIKGVWVVFS